MTTPAELRDVGAAIGRDIMAYLRTEVANSHRPDLKSSAADFVTAIDRASEERIVAALAQLRPGDGVLGEEGSDTESTTGVRWIIDPIDGTTNFVYGVPAFSVSIAAEQDGQVVAGVVGDVMHDELFDAFRGGGARCNGEAIAPRPTTAMNSAVMATGFGFDPEHRVQQGEVLVRLLPHIGNMRRFGSAAIDLCWVACGRVDGFWEVGLNPWDFSAGALIAAEAGAVVHGGASPLPTPQLTFACTPALADELAQLLQQAGVTGT